MAASNPPPNPAEMLHGEAALRMQIGATRFNADWKHPEHRTRRLLAEFIGTAGLTFVLSAGAAILSLYAGRPLHPFEAAFILSAISALWLVVAVYSLGDISAHFNPAMTLAFTLRGDMGWPMCGAYVTVQLLAAVAGSLLAREPYHWLGDLGGPEALMDETFTRRMGGHDIDAAEGEALFDWLDGVRPVRGISLVSEAVTEEGRAVFERARCAECHAGAGLTTNGIESVRPGSEAVKTPTLLGVGTRSRLLHLRPIESNDHAHVAASRVIDFGTE